jgi:acyl-CoA thioester hydrolase
MGFMVNQKKHGTGRSGYSAWEIDRIRFSDTDCLGEVNNIAIAAYVETGRVALAMEIAENAPSHMRDFTLVHVAVDYRDFLYYPGTVEVGSVVASIGRTSYTITSGVFDGERCVATAEGVLVMLSEGRPAPIEGNFRVFLEGLTR